MRPDAPPLPPERATPPATMLHCDVYRVTFWGEDDDTFFSLPRAGTGTSVCDALGIFCAARAAHFGQPIERVRGNVRSIEAVTAFQGFHLTPIGRPCGGKDGRG